MKLMGIAILSTTYSKTGIPNHRFKLPYSDKLFTTNSYSRYLDKIGKTVTQMILDLNQVDRESLPKCRICKENYVRLIGNNLKNLKRVDIFNPVVDSTCSNIDCIRSIKASKANFTAYINGNHATQNSLVRSTFYKTFEYEGKMYHFRSGTELKFFKRFSRLISTHYIGERALTKYDYDGRVRNYLPDFTLRSNLDLPKVIEIKCGNIFSEFGDDVSQKNYLKFKSVLDQGYDLMLIDYKFGSRDFKKYHLKNLDQLKSLFKLQ